MVIKVKPYDYDYLINKVIKQKFYFYKNNTQFEINDDLSNPENITHYMKRLLMVIYRTYINKDQRNNLLNIYLKYIEQFMIKFELNRFHKIEDIYKAAKIIFDKTVNDCIIIQGNNLNQNPWDDTKDIIFENNLNELKQLRVD